MEEVGRSVMSQETVWQDLCKYVISTSGEGGVCISPIPREFPTRGGEGKFSMGGSQGTGIPGSILALGLSGFLLFFILSLLVGSFGNLHLFSSPVRQPIQFNHLKHVEEYEMDCDTCHEFFQQESFSGLPSADLCSTCHLEPLGESEEE